YPWPAPIGLCGPVRPLAHPGRLDLQPVPPEPVLGLSKRSLHLGLPLRRELVELSYLTARSFRRSVVATVHGVSELEQEAGPETAHSLELAAQREHAAGRTTSRRERVSRQARGGPHPRKGLGG